MAQYERVFAETFRAAGTPDRARALIAMVTPPPSKPTATAAPPSPPSGNGAAVATSIATESDETSSIAIPLVKPSFRKVSLKPESTTSYYACDACACLKGKLWIAAQSLPRNIMPSPNTPKERGTLWVHDPSGNQTTRVSDQIGEHSSIKALQPCDGKLWMALQFDGVWCLDPDSLQVQRFTAKDGLLSSNMHAIGAAGDLLYFGGGRMADGVIAVYRRPTQTWGEQEISAGNVRDGRSLLQLPSVPILTRLTPCKRWLMASAENPMFRYIRAMTSTTARFSHSVGDNVLLLDTRASSWTRLNDLLLRQFPPNPKIDSLALTACAADASGFWMGTTRGLIFLDPETNRMEAWPQLPGVVKELLDDGEFLWVAVSDSVFYYRSRLSFYLQNRTPQEGQSNTERILLLHKPDRKWVAQFIVPAPANCMATSDSSLWIGLETPDLEGNCILEVDKKELTSIPKDKWVEP
jgi:hypothetical protein